MTSAPISVNLRVSKQHDDNDEWENHFILRVPEGVANRMEKAVNHDPYAEELGINIHDDNRTVQIRLGNQILPAKILDLPTVNELHKTMDNATLYKVSNISQIIMCDDAMPLPKNQRNEVKKEEVENTKPKIETPDDSGEGAVVKVKTARQLAKEKVKEYHFPHGITPPMKNAKKRRFRKKKQKKTMAVEEIERELKRLLRSDTEALSVRWEIVDDDGTNPQDDEDVEVYDADDGSDLDKDDDKDLFLSDDEDTL